MASTLKVDRIEATTPGGDITFASPVNPDGYSSNYRPGEIIECITSQCNGSVVESQLGSHTFINVNTPNTPGTSYVTLPESSITYQPPAGTSRVVYEFCFNFSNDNITNAHNILHTRFQIDGQDVVYAQKTISGNNHSHQQVIWRWVIAIAGTADDMNLGTVASWDAPKTLSLRVRNYGSNNSSRLYSSQYWDGGGSVWTFAQPSLSVTAIA